MEITNGLGYDLILDFGGSMSTMKRQCLKLASFYGVIATSYEDMQLDPPESKFLNQKCAILTFINFRTILESGLHDGVAKTLMDDLHEKLINNEFGHTMSSYINSSGNKGSNPTYNGRNDPLGKMGDSNNKGMFKRYSILDLFDEQYGHLQRNEILEHEKQINQNQ